MLIKIYYIIISNANLTYFNKKKCAKFAIFNIEYTESEYQDV